MTPTEREALSRAADALALTRGMLFDAEARLQGVESELARVLADVRSRQTALRAALEEANAPLGRCWHGLEHCIPCYRRRP